MDGAILATLPIPPMTSSNQPAPLSEVELPNGFSRRAPPIEVELERAGIAAGRGTRLFRLPPLPRPTACMMSPKSPLPLRDPSDKNQTPPPGSPPR